MSAVRSGQRPVLAGMIHSMSSATSVRRAALSPRPMAAKKSFTVWTFCSVLTEDSLILCDAGSDLGHASIDGEIHAGDVGAFVGSEERDGSRDFFGSPLRPIGTCEANWRPPVRLARG
jgi:hypothetical protein